jgi:hypothetical protein
VVQREIQLDFDFLGLDPLLTTHFCKTAWLIVSVVVRTSTTSI